VLLTSRNGGRVDRRGELDDESARRSGCVGTRIGKLLAALPRGYTCEHCGSQAIPV
jgi:hypothetical protein